MIDVGRIGIWAHCRTPLDMLETLVVVLGGGKDGPQRIPQRIERDDVRVRDGRHC
jgi:hypothetical protein